MWIISEVLREAANRLPQHLGTVGAVVVGTAIVKAGIVDPIMIVLVTRSAIGLYTLPVSPRAARSARRPVSWPAFACRS